MLLVEFTVYSPVAGQRMHWRAARDRASWKPSRDNRTGDLSRDAENRLALLLMNWQSGKRERYIL